MPSLGETFSDRRRQLGISIAQAEGDTKIRGRSLEALENGNYDSLPAPGYVRGYVTSYARYLDLDPVQMIAMYRAETGNARQHRIVPPDEAVKPRHELNAIPWRTAAVAAVTIALIVLIGWGITTVTRKHATVAPIQSDATSATAQAGGQGVKPLAAAPFSVKIAVSPTGAAYVSVRVDGAAAYQGTLTGGQTKQFQATKSVVIKTDRPSALTVSKDGNSVKLTRTSSGGSITLTANSK